MPRLTVLALTLALTPAALFAGTPTETCLKKADTPAAEAACIGASARACIGAIAGADPLDMAMCINTETEWWQSRLNAAYEAMLARAVELDEVNAAGIAKGAPAFADDMVEIHASWKDWTEKRCTFASMLKRGDPTRMVAAADCMLDQIANQTLLYDQSAR